MPTMLPKNRTWLTGAVPESLGEVRQVCSDADPGDQKAGETRQNGERKGQGEHLGRRSRVVAEDVVDLRLGAVARRRRGTRRRIGRRGELKGLGLERLGRAEAPDDDGGGQGRFGRQERGRNLCRSLHRQHASTPEAPLTKSNLALPLSFTVSGNDSSKLSSLFAMVRKA